MQYKQMGKMLTPSVQLRKGQTMHVVIAMVLTCLTVFPGVCT